MFTNPTPAALGVIGRQATDGPPLVSRTADELEAARLVRLLAATVSMVSVGYDPLAEEPVLEVALCASARALDGLARGNPEAMVDAIDELSATVASLPGPWA